MYVRLLLKIEIQEKCIQNIFPTNTICTFTFINKTTTFNCSIYYAIRCYDYLNYKNLNKK